MNIYNKFLKISTEDVDKGYDIFKLKEWLLKVEENLLTLSIAIERVPDSRTKSARKLQIILKQQIQSRINYLKTKKSYNEILLDLLKTNVSPLLLIELEEKAKQLSTLQ